MFLGEKMSQSVEQLCFQVLYNNYELGWISRPFRGGEMKGYKTLDEIICSTAYTLWRLSLYKGAATHNSFLIDLNVQKRYFPKHKWFSEVWEKLNATS